MGRAPAKAKAKAKLPVAPKSSKNNDSARVRDLEKRLAEALKREAEALEQQTATAEILRVISSSPTDVQPVFDAIAQSARRLCGGDFSVVVRYDGELLHRGSEAHATAEGIQAIRSILPVRPSRAFTVARAVLERAVVHLPDVQADPEMDQSVAAALRNRSAVAVPMLRDGQPLGSIGVGRFEARPFTAEQIQLLKTFADQAVIAIENVRLFNELEASNRELTESLEQQTATAEILRVISASPTDVQPVFDTIAASAARLCRGTFGVVYRFDGRVVDVVAHHSMEPGALEELLRAYPMAPSRRPDRSFLRRAGARAGRLAPVPGVVGTAYGIRHAFHAIDASGHATSSVVPAGILAALVATVTALLLIIPLATVSEVLRRGRRR